MADNRDPRDVKRNPDDHPVGAGLGAVGGAAAGAAIGSVAGPIGTVVGGVAGGLAGGMAGHAIADMIDPKVEDEYWRTNFSSRPYSSVCPVWRAKAVWMKGDWLCATGLPSTT